MKKLLFLIPVILLITAACNSQPTQPQTNQQVNNPQQQTQPSSTPQQGDAGQQTNWQSYINNRVGYQFEYPSKNLTLALDETIKYPDLQTQNQDLVQFALDTKDKSEQQPLTMSVRTNVGVQNSSIENWIQNGSGSDPDLANYTKRFIGGQTAYTARGLSVTYVLYNNNVYVIEAHAGIKPASDTDPVYQHLLTTFKFTNTVALDNYLVINAWGVKFEKPQGMNDLLYITKPFSYSTGDNTVALITQRLVDLNKSIGGKCNEYYLGLLGRLTEKGLQDAQKNGPGISDYVKIGNYYYYFTLPQEACFYNNSYDNEYAKLSGSQSSSLKVLILKTLKVDP